MGSTSGPPFTFGSFPTGYAGYNAFIPTKAKGTPFGPGEIEEAYSAPFQYLARGSALAEEATRQGAYDRFRARVSGYAGGRAEEGRRLAVEGASSGYSPELLRRQQFARQAEDQAFYGAQTGDRDSMIAEVAAELRRNTGVEFAALSESQRAEVVNNYLNYKARVAARSAGKRGLLGGLGGALLGGLSDVASSAVSSTGSAAGVG